MNEDRWQQVDSVANVFLACYNNRDTRSIRLSCILKEQIRPELLQQALDETIRVKDQFQVRIRSGIFWHYIETSKIRPVVKEEDGRICSLLYKPRNEKKLHYRVLWYRNRISFEAFHAICDGTGAMDFLNELVLQYLKLSHGKERFGDLSFGSDSQEEREEDSFRKYQGGESSAPEQTGRAYHFQGGRLPYDQLQYFDVQIPLKEMLAKAKSHQTTLTVYLAALLVRSIVQDMPASKTSEPVTIAVPVNLRSYYPSHTARNFFNNVKLTHHYTGTETIESLAEELNAQLKENLQPEVIRARMNYYQNVQDNAAIRAVPLFLKERGLSFLTKQDDQTVSAVISNLGIIKIPKEMEEFIDHYCVYGTSENLFMAVSSFTDKLVVNFISPYKSTGVIRDFVRELSSDIGNIKVDASEVIR